MKPPDNCTYTIRANSETLQKARWVDGARGGRQCTLDLVSAAPTPSPPLQSFINLNRASKTRDWLTHQWLKYNFLLKIPMVLNT